MLKNFKKEGRGQGMFPRTGTLDFCAILIDAARSTISLTFTVLVTLIVEPGSTINSVFLLDSLVFCLFEFKFYFLERVYSSRVNPLQKIKLYALKSVKNTNSLKPHELKLQTTQGKRLAIQHIKQDIAFSSRVKSES